MPPRTVAAGPAVEDVVAGAAAQLVVAGAAASLSLPTPPSTMSVARPAVDRRRCRHRRDDVVAAEPADHVPAARAAQLSGPVCRRSCSALAGRSGRAAAGVPNEASRADARPGGALGDEPVVLADPRRETGEVALTWISAVPEAEVAAVRNPYAALRPYSNHQLVVSPRGLRVPLTRALVRLREAKSTGPVAADGAPVVTNVASAPRDVPSALRRRAGSGRSSPGLRLRRSRRSVSPSRSLRSSGRLRAVRRGRAELHVPRWSCARSG